MKLSPSSGRYGIKITPPEYNSKFCGKALLGVHSICGVLVNAITAKATTPTLIGMLVLAQLKSHYRLLDLPCTRTIPDLDRYVRITIANKYEGTDS